LQYNFKNFQVRVEMSEVRYLEADKKLMSPVELTGVQEAAEYD